MNKYYISTMYRWGCRENHSYVLGLFSDLHIAIRETIQEENNRGGGKYIGEIIEVEMGDVLKLEDKYHKIAHGETKLNCEVCDNKKCYTKTIWKKSQKKKDEPW